MTESGLFGKAKEAKEQYSKSEAMEKVQLEVLASYDTTGDLSLTKLKDNINTNIKDAKIEESETGKFPITVEVGGEKFTVKENGEVSHAGKGGTGGGLGTGEDSPLLGELDSELQDKLKEDIKKIQNLDIAETNPLKAMPSETTQILDGDANNGIVIKDSKENEWVWVEVPMSVTKDAVFDDEIESALKDYSKDYSNGLEDQWHNGCGLTATEYENKKSKMLQSIKANGGFWISRYEAGIDGSAENLALFRKNSSSITTSSADAVSKPNHIPYTNIYCEDSQKLADRMYKGNDITSSLMFGIQWDLTCKYLEEKGNWDTKENTAMYYIKEDSTSWGNYINSQFNLSRGAYGVNSSFYGIGSFKVYTENTSNVVQECISNSKKTEGILITTGASEQCKKMNIYDFAGNATEWTFQKSNYVDYKMVYRGGHCKQEGNKNSNTTFSGNGGGFSSIHYSTDVSGFRITLY